MKTPPLLLGVALLFWGWQTGFPVVGAAMALVLESARLIKARWEFSDDDFSRIWSVCTLLFLGAAVYAFTDNGGPARFGNFFENSNPAAQSGIALASSKTAGTILRWLPMVLFLFVAAQTYSSREQIPWTAISLILRYRWKKAEKAGRPLPPAHVTNVSHLYFAVCLFAASLHPGENSNNYFWGLCVLLAWALWSQRTRRFGIAIWAGTLATVFGLGYYGQEGIGRLQSYLQNLDTQFLENFMHRRGADPTLSQTSLGQIGRLKLSGKIIIRLQPADGSGPPAYLREASYRVFNSPQWRSGSSREGMQTLPELLGNSGIWSLIPGKTNTAVVNISCYLDDQSRESGARLGLLPLPTGSSRLEKLRDCLLKANNLGTVLAEGPGLVMFDVHYGPGVTMDAPPAALLETNEDLAVPLREKPALDQVIAELQVKGQSADDQLRTIHSFFQDRFTYRTWQEPLSQKGTNETATSRFLLRTRVGHCEYFATATVLLLRELGIPARYAIGYSVHEVSGKGYVVRLRDAHAWCLVWNDKARIWQDFDTTPATWVAEESKQTSVFQSLSDLWAWIEFQFSKFRWGQSNLRPYLLATLAPALVVLLYQLFFRRKRRRREKRNEPPPDWPGLDSDFYLIERKLAARGVRRRPNELLSDWLQRALADPALAGVSDPLRDLLRLHYRYRFDPQGLTGADREALKQRTRRALETL